MIARHVSCSRTVTKSRWGILVAAICVGHRARCMASLDQPRDVAEQIHVLAVADAHASVRWR